MKFRVIWEVEIDAKSPKQAVEQARALQMNPDMPATVFDVWEHARQRMHRIDLVPAANRLARAELNSIRAAMRLLQCSPQLSRELKAVVTVMLIFLDDGEGRPLKTPLPRL